MRRRRSLGRGLYDALSSQGLACVLICLLGLLTWLGTLEQVERGLYDVQKTYFESYVLVHRAGPVPIPLPGANLVLSLLAINLLLGGIVRLRKGRGTAGVLVTHLGIAMLLASSFVKLHHSEDGHVTLYEGRSASHFQSYHENELALLRPLVDGRFEERVVSERALRRASPERPLRLEDPDLPFSLEITHWLENARPIPAGAASPTDGAGVDGFVLRAEPRDAQSERNGPGLRLTLVQRGGERRAGLLWAFDAAPWTVEVEGRTYALDLRRRRFPMPFEVRLDTFTKQDHPRTGMPKWFSSDVTLRQQGVERPVRISMNEPLREGGLVLYQASWGPSNARPGDPLFSTLAVVRNPADQWPLAACVVITLGLCAHFGRKLLRHVRAEARRS